MHVFLFASLLLVLHFVALQGIPGVPTTPTITLQGSASYNSTLSLIINGASFAASDTVQCEWTRPLSCVDLVGFDLQR